MRQIAWTRVLVLILLAVLCAAVSNLAASRERKLPWVGSYSRALETAPASEANAARETPVSAPLAATAGPSASAPSDLAAAGSFAPHPDKAAVEIGTDGAEALFRQGRLFLDARRTTVYADGHVQGARSFPVWESDIADRVKAFYEEGGGTATRTRRSSSTAAAGTAKTP